MNKKLLICCVLLSVSGYAETYKMGISKKHLKDISIEDYVSPNNPLTCESPLILNEEKDECVALTCESPLVLNDSEDTCIDPIAAVGWINTSNSCGGLAPASYNSRVVFAISKSSNYPSSSLEIPKGYRWLSSTEWKAYYEAGNKAIVNTNYTLKGKCGYSGYPYSMNEGSSQYWNHFNNGRSIHTGHRESTNGSNYNYTNNNSGYFSGYVLYKED
jgi:hypothetical protein